MRKFGVACVVLAFGAVAPFYAAAEEPPAGGEPVAAQEDVGGPEVEEVADRAAPENETADKAKKVCKYEKMTGTRFGKRVCMTQAEWDLLRKDSQEGVRSAQRKNSAPGTGQ